MLRCRSCEAKRSGAPLWGKHGNAVCARKIILPLVLLIAAHLLFVMRSNVIGRHASQHAFHHSAIAVIGVGHGIGLRGGGGCGGKSFSGRRGSGFGGGRCDHTVLIRGFTYSPMHGLYISMKKRSPFSEERFITSTSAPCLNLQPQ